MPEDSNVLCFFPRCARLIPSSFINYANELWLDKSSLIYLYIDFALAAPQTHKNADIILGMVLILEFIYSFCLQLNEKKER